MWQKTKMVDTEMTDAEPLEKELAPKMVEIAPAAGKEKSAKHLPDSEEDIVKKLKADLKESQDYSMQLRAALQRKEDEKQRVIQQKEAALEQRSQQLIQRHQSQMQQLEHGYLREQHDSKAKYDTMYRNLSAQLRQSAEKTRQVDSQLRDVQSETVSIAEELKDCKDELFALQPQNDIPDSQIHSEWEGLCDNIVRWVDDEAGDIDNLHARLESVRARGGGNNEIIDKYWNPDTQMMASREPGAFEDLLRYNIHLLLETKLFNENLNLLGSIPETYRLVCQMAIGLGNLQPRRSPLSVAIWRSEALNAVTTFRGFADRHEKATQIITKIADDFLSPVLPKMAEGALQRFHQEITMPAVKLDSAIRRSINSYRFVFGRDSRASQSPRPPLDEGKERRKLFKEDVEKFEIIDVDSRRRLRPNQPLVHTQKGVVGEQLLLIHPALYRQRREGNDILLKKAVIVAKMFESMTSRGKPTSHDSNKNYLWGILNLSK